MGRTTGNFERALGHARSTPEGEDDLLVLRDRARFNVASGNIYQALSDYRDVVSREVELSREGEELASVLGLADLRRAATLAADGNISGSAAVPSAVDLSLALISREAWSSESKGVRLEDLGALVERAKLSDADRARARSLFVGLPVQGIDPADAELPADAPWLGLETDPEQLASLRALVGVLEAPLPIDSAPEDSIEPLPEPSEDGAEEDSSEVPERRS